MMKIYIIIAIIILVGVAIYVESRTYNPISFREAMDLTDNPIITFYNNGKRLNFLLDTGANRSIINIDDLKECNYTKSETFTSNIGIEGNKKYLPNVTVDLEYNDTIYQEEFLANDLNEAIEEIKKTTGVTIHGLLGTTFFTKYKYVLDFDSMIAYSKKRL